MPANTQTKSGHRKECHYSPLELLNLYYSDGQTTGNRKNTTWQKMNSLLSWDNIIERGYQSNLCPLLHFILNKWIVDDGLFATPNPLYSSSLQYKSQGLPLKYLEALKNEYNSCLMKNLIFFDEIDSIKAHLLDERLDFIFLKGADFTEKLYNIALRPMSDIDILIRHDSLAHATKMLNRLGYHEDIFSGNEKHAVLIKFINNDFAIPVELHIDIVSKQLNIPLKLSDVWSESQNNSMAIHHNINYLCYHLAYHRFDRLMWIIDLAFLIKSFNENIHWSDVYDTAYNWKLHYFLDFVLLILSDLFPSICLFFERQVEPRLFSRFAIAKFFFLILQSRLRSGRNIKIVKHLLRITLFPRTLDMFSYIGHKTSNCI